MSIEFIRDEFLEGKKEELESIEKELSKKPRIMDKNALFLRRFTLALMGQYKLKDKKLNKKENLPLLNEKILKNEIHKPIKQRQMPIAGLQVPSPYQKIPEPPQRYIQRPQLKIPSPIKEELKIPEPISTNELKKEEAKKESTIPNPL